MNLALFCTLFGCLLDISVKYYSNLCWSSRSGAPCLSHLLMGQQAEDADQPTTPETRSNHSITVPPKTG